jgi:hypothetical protein
MVRRAIVGAIGLILMGGIVSACGASSPQIYDAAASAKCLRDTKSRFVIDVSKPSRLIVRDREHSKGQRIGVTFERPRVEDTNGVEIFFFRRWAVARGVFNAAVSDVQSTHHAAALIQQIRNSVLEWDLPSTKELRSIVSKCLRH